jgi:hypothetical protein
MVSSSRVVSRSWNWSAAMRPIIRSGVFVVGFAGLHLSATAADIEVHDGEAGEPAFISVEGYLKLGDEQKFFAKALPLKSAVVAFTSSGGNLFAGIEMGRAIRLKEFVTVVPDDMLCASACALAWLGGRVRSVVESHLLHHGNFATVDGMAIVRNGREKRH